MTQNDIKTTTKSLTIHKWEAVINEFITNGRNAPKAYAKVYKDCKTVFQTANQLFKNTKFNKMLEKRLRKISEKADIEVGILEAMYQKGYNTADVQSNPTGMAVNTTGIARLYGKDKDNDIGTATAPPPISQSDLEVLRKLSLELNKRTLVESEVIENE